MRYLCVYKPGHDGSEQSPAPANEIYEMGKLVDDMSRAGVLLATGGCRPGVRAVRVATGSAESQVTDGPFAATEHIGGYCLLQVKSKAEAVEWAKRFLAVVRRGRSELFELEDFTPPAA